MAVAIDIENLTKRYPAFSGYRDLIPSLIKPKKWVDALNGVSLKIEEGEVFGLLGPNGAGKTTLLKVLCTLLLPTSGRAACAGFDTVKDEQRVKEAVGFISSEERSFYWRLTGRQNLEFYGSLYGMKGLELTYRIDELLTMVGLTEQASRRFNTYSTGMRQRLAIARGLLHDPRLLFVDEPTKGLDPINSHNIREFIRKELTGHGRTVILATHHMVEAEQLCNRVAIMNRGRIVAHGSVAELRSIISNKDVCHLEVKNFTDRLLAGLRVLPGVESFCKGGQQDGVSTIDVVLSDRRLALPEITRYIVNAGGEICDLSIARATLEEILTSIVSESTLGAS